MILTMKNALRMIGIALLFVTFARAEQKIQVGETIQVFVWGLEEDLSQKVIVRSDGYIFLPWVGEVRAGGKSYAEIQSIIKSRLSRYFKNFEVAVAPFEGKLFVSVMGVVATVGPVDYFPGMTVAEAIAAAGGLSSKSSGIVRIISKNHKVRDVDLNKIFNESKSEENTLLQAGDILYALPDFEEKEIVVTVLGRVNKQGAMRLPKGADLFTAIIATGGVSAEVIKTPSGGTFAGTKFGTYDIQVKRQGKTVRKAVLDGTEMKLTEFATSKQKKRFRLRTGDVILVVPAKQAVAILGNVKVPGLYELDKGMRVSDLIVRSGGFTKDPYLKKSGIIREKDGKAVWIDVNLEQIFRKGNFETNIVLKPKDIVFVPNRTRRYTIDTILSTVSKIFFPARAVDELLNIIR